jgi:tetratricopeptide (TPR) repeat protein
VVTGDALTRTIEQIIEQQNGALAAHLQQHTEVQRIGSQALQYFTEPPQTVGQRLSLVDVPQHMRELLKASPGATDLPSMVQETIAEDIESGRIALQQMPQAVTRWSQHLTEWRERLAAEPDRKAAERLHALLMAGKLDEARALYDELIRATEARAAAEHHRLASYYAGRADTLTLQLKWREAVADLEKAVTHAKQAFPDARHPDVATHLNNLGLTWDHLGEYPTAIEYFTQALAILETTLPHEHPTIQLARANLIAAQQAQARAAT